MDSQLLRSVQLTQLDISKEIKKICEKHQIPYFLDGGSLLGAVRHQGFIPWDDDMDFGMLREDYERFLQIAPQELPAPLFLQTTETDSGYGYAFAKIRNRDSLYLERVSQNSTENHGIFVDIFPYDALPDDARKAQKLYHQLTALKMILKVKVHYKPWNASENINKKRWFLYLPARFLSVFMPKERIVKQYNRIATRYNSSSTARYYAQVAESFGHWEMERAFFSSRVELPFENVTFSAPGDYDGFLTAGYGDYMKLPPEDKRSSTHGILQVKLGKPLLS